MTCPECCSELDEIKPDLYQCDCCGFLAEQMSWDVDQEGADLALKPNV